MYKILSKNIFRNISKKISRQSFMVKIFDLNLNKKSKNFNFVRSIESNFKNFSNHLLSNCILLISEVENFCWQKFEFRRALRSGAKLLEIFEILGNDVKFLEWKKFLTNFAIFYWENIMWQEAVDRETYPRGFQSSWNYARSPLL